MIGRGIRWTALLLAPVLCVSQTDDIAKAIDKLQAGNTAAAEQILREDLSRHPGDAIAAGVLAVVLDQEHRYAEASPFFARALAHDDKDPALLNNYGNHLLAIGKPEQARDAYRKVLSLEPAHVNARLQLATLALQHRQISEAEEYLAKLPSSALKTPQAFQVRMHLGAALAAAGQYARAQAVFQELTTLEPWNAEANYDLGLAAFRAGYTDVAKRSLTKALELQPDNAAAMYDLAVVDRGLNQDDAALEFAARACRLQPRRADVHRLLAQLLADEGFFSDAVTAWNDYLALSPSDEVARRERAFAQTAIGHAPDTAVTELRSFAVKHPQDAVAHYELGLAIATQEPDASKRELDRAIALRPDFASARVARGLWFNRQGQTALALADFQVAAEHEAGNPNILDHLAEAYIATGQPGPALPLLEKAAELAPDNPTIALHLARAKLKAGDTPGAETLFARVRALRASPGVYTHSAGLLDFLRLSPDQQMAKYKAGVQQTAMANPANAEAQSRYLELLAESGPGVELQSTCENLARLNADAALFVSAVRAILSAEVPATACASSLLAAGLRQYPADKDLAALQRVADQLVQTRSAHLVNAPPRDLR